MTKLVSALYTSEMITSSEVQPLKIKLIMLPAARVTVSPALYSPAPVTEALLPMTVTVYFTSGVPFSVRAGSMNKNEAQASPITSASQSNALMAPFSVTASAVSAEVSYPVLISTFTSSM